MTSPEYRVQATDAFEEDLTAATKYMLDSAGRLSAKRFLDRYAEMRLLLSAFPFHGSPVGAGGLRWRELNPFTAVYEIDEKRRSVTLLRLHYRASNWRTDLIGVE